MNPEKILVQQFVLRCRAHARRRLMIRAVTDFCLYVGLVSGISVAITHWTLRGDIAAQFLCAGTVLGLCGYLAYVLRKIIKVWSHPLIVAKKISQSNNPLRRLDGSLSESTSLRHDILGATQFQYGVRSASHYSEQLTDAYIERTGKQLQSISPSSALDNPNWHRRAPLIVFATTIFGGLFQHPNFQLAWFRTIDHQDARPIPAPEPLWSYLELTLDFPDHTFRNDKTIVNFSGSILIPAGTQVRLMMRSSEENRAAEIYLFEESEGDEIRLDSAPSRRITLDPIAPMHAKEEDQVAWLQLQGNFKVTSPGRWFVAVPSNSQGHRIARRSAETSISIEIDHPPEIELHAFDDPNKMIDNTVEIDLKFHAMDDFGLGQAKLIYMWPDGETHELPIASPEPGRRDWNHRYAWDLSAIPTERRNELSYWIEIRDNDPGLGPDGPYDPVGKVTRSVQRQLHLKDSETVHAANIESLRHIRDLAVDLLAARMQSDLFSSRDEQNQLQKTWQRLNTIHQSTHRLLTLLASTVDAYALDKQAQERTVRSIAAIHERLYEHQDQANHIFSILPADIGTSITNINWRSFSRFFSQIQRNNQTQISALEDELIRLDDLVDEQIIERLELLLARLQTTQQKLVELLEQLASGDESVRGQIELLQQKARLDLARINQARAQLSKELGEEFINQDAFRAMEARMRFMELSERLRKGDTEGALQQARESLEQLRKLRGSVQERLAQDQGDESRLSPEARARMQLLRELGRMKDQQSGIELDTKKLAKQWRKQLKNNRIDSTLSKRASRSIYQAERQIQEVNDARLSREGRQALDDLQQTLQSLHKKLEQESPSLVEVYEQLRKAMQLNRLSQAGSESKEKEAKILRSVEKQLDQLEKQIRAEIPEPSAVFDENAMKEFSKLSESQQQLRLSTNELLQSEPFEILPESGQRALRSASRQMQESSDELGSQESLPALDHQGAGVKSIQRAIDSLQQAPPPPPAGTNEKSSTEAFQDRSLREQVIEAMRQSGTRDLDKTAERYYEELLR